MQVCEQTDIQKEREKERKPILHLFTLGYTNKLHSLYVGPLLHCIHRPTFMIN